MDEKTRLYFENPRKIKAVKPLDNYVLLLKFDNGEIKKFDMCNELTGVFEVLKAPEKFRKVFINQVGNIAWNIDDNIDSSKHWENEIDLCKDMLYMESVETYTPNKGTVEAMKELEEGRGETFSGSTDDFFNLIQQD